MLSTREQAVLMLLAVCGCAFLAIACEPSLPDDLDSLSEAMNSNSETVLLSASNKVARVYGQNGLLHVLHSGKPEAKAQAARVLRRFPGDEVERALLAVVQTESDDHVRVHALSSLGAVGTSRALPVLDAAAAERDALVAYSARHSAAEIRYREERETRPNGETLRIDDVRITTWPSRLMFQYHTPTSSRDCKAQATEMPKVWDLVVKPRLGDSHVRSVTMFPEDDSGWSVSMEFTKSASGQWSTAAPCSMSIPAR